MALSEPPGALVWPATEANIEAAAQALAAGHLLALPTETVYGLGARADSDAAVAQIFAAKGRPSDHPLIVHVAQASDAQAFASELPEFAQKLMAAFWPGPLTVIVPRKAGVATASAGGQASIGLRCPSHPVAQQLLRACQRLGVPGVAAPSANQFGRVSPTTAAHVAAEFASLQPPLRILDGGACSVGIESSIVDCTRGAPVLLRPGVLTPAQLQAAMGQDLLLNSELNTEQIRRDDAHSASKTTPTVLQQAPRASGTLEAHYAPNAKLRLMSAEQLQAALDVLGADARHIATYSQAVLQSSSTHIIRRRMPFDAAATAQQLFAVLREFDAQGAKLIWVQAPPPGPEWDGVRDRLQRAAASG
jgi:L-threonylcarbamoyladenylate synthase